MSKQNEYITKRDLHREYLKSPAWRKFRKVALAHYGAICNRCGEYGNDVDHMTYKNWGNEKLEDVQILCRPCHEAKHAVERAAPKKKGRGKRTLHKRGLWAYLTGKQKEKLMKDFDFETEAQLMINYFDCSTMTPLIQAAADMMNVNVFGLKPRTKKGWAGLAKAKRDRRKRNRKLTAAESERLIRAAQRHRKQGGGAAS